MDPQERKRWQLAGPPQVTGTVAEGPSPMETGMSHWGRDAQAGRPHLRTGTEQSPRRPPSHKTVINYDNAPYKWVSRQREEQVIHPQLMVIWPPARPRQGSPAEGFPSLPGDPSGSFQNGQV